MTLFTVEESMSLKFGIKDRGQKSHLILEKVKRKLEGNPINRVFRELKTLLDFSFCMIFRSN